MSRQFYSYKDMIDYFGYDPAQEDEGEDQQMRVMQEASAAEELVIEEFNRDFPLGGPDQAQVPPRELPKDELPF